MERESNPMQPMCRAGCGFYGNPAQEGFCSVCYKDVLRKKQQPPVSSTPSSNNAPQTPAPSQSVTASSVSIRPVATPSSFASTIGSSSTTTTSASSASPSAASPSASSCAASANNPAVSASYSAQSTVHSALFCSDKDEENQGDELQNLSFHSTNYGHGKCNSCEVDPVQESSDAYGDLLVQSWIVEKEEDDEEDEDVDLFSITDCPNSKAECDSDSNDEYLLYEFLGESKSTCVDPPTSRSLESVKSVAGKKDKSNNLQSSSNGGGGVMRKRKICTDDSGSLGGHSNNSSIADNDDKDGDKEDAKKKKNRCATCRKKVGLTGFECRCGGLFCAIHRYSDKHECSFDYRELGAAEIRRNNPVVVGEKIQKI